MTERGYLNPGSLGNDEDREFVTMPLEREAVRLISAFLHEHDAELEAALAPIGIDWRSVMMPAWERAFMPADLARLARIVENEDGTVRSEPVGEQP